MRFSIITCTYNSEKYLQKNIDSVKNQTFDDFEHIFIDGFSTDGTVEIIKQYQQEFPDKVRFYQFEPKGIANAMNRGIEKASGEYLLHLHSDDSLYGNNVLSSVVDFIQKNNSPDLIYGKAKFMNDEGVFRIIPHRKIYHKLRHWLLLLTNYVPHQATFIKKTIFEKYGLFNEQYKNSMDYEMWLRLSKNNIDAIYFDSIICNFLMRSDSQSTIGSKNSAIEHTMIQQKYIKSRLMRLFLSLVIDINNKRKLI